MKTITIILLSITSLFSQREVGIIITGYNKLVGQAGISNVSFSDTSYYSIDEKAWSVLNKDTVFYKLYSEISPVKNAPICNFYYYLDAWGSDSTYNTYPVLFYITRQKLISLGKL